MARSSIHPLRASPDGVTQAKYRAGSPAVGHPARREPALRTCRRTSDATKRWRFCYWKAHLPRTKWSSWRDPKPSESHVTPAGRADAHLYATRLRSFMIESRTSYSARIAFKASPFGVNTHLANNERPARVRRAMEIPRRAGHQTIDPVYRPSSPRSKNQVSRRRPLFVAVSLSGSGHAPDGSKIRD